MTAATSDYSTKRPAPKAQHWYLFSSENTSFDTKGKMKTFQKLGQAMLIMIQDQPKQKGFCFVYVPFGILYRQTQVEDTKGEWQSGS